MIVTMVAAPRARAAADPATDRDVGDVEGAAKGKVPEISSLTACDAAAILTDKGVGGVEGAAKVTVPKIAALPACAAAATLIEKDVCGFEGAANVTVTMIATVPAYAGAATLTDKDERRRRRAQMIPSFSIGARTLLNDCNHSATAFFLEVSNNDSHLPHKHSAAKRLGSTIPLESDGRPLTTPPVAALSVRALPLTVRVPSFSLPWTPPTSPPPPLLPSPLRPPLPSGSKAKGSAGWRHPTDAVSASLGGSIRPLPLLSVTRSSGSTITVQWPLPLSSTTTTSGKSMVALAEKRGDVEGEIFMP